MKKTPYGEVSKRYTQGTSKKIKTVKQLMKELSNLPEDMPVGYPETSQRVIVVNCSYSSCHVILEEE